MIVDVLHPAPVSYVPARGRNERFAMVACRTPAELVEDDLSRSVETGPLFPQKVGVGEERLRLLDGRLWCPVSHRGLEGGSREATLDEFLSCLSGRVAPDDARGFMTQFAGTPLVAMVPEERRSSLLMSLGLQSRGEEIDLRGARAMRLDRRERAAADLSRYLSENVRVLDGRPYVRSTPFLLVDGVRGQVTYDVESSVWPSSRGMRTFPCDHGTADGAVSVLRDLFVHPALPEAEAARRRWEAAVPEGTLEGDDVGWLLNSFAGPVRRKLDEQLSYASMPRVREHLAVARDKARVVEVAAMTGTAQLDGDVAVLGLRDALRELLGRPRNGSHGEEFLAAYLERIVIPRLGAVAPADEEAMGGLAP